MLSGNVGHLDLEDVNQNTRGATPGMVRGQAGLGPRYSSPHFSGYAAVTHVPCQIPAGTWLLGSWWAMCPSPAPHLPPQGPGRLQRLLTLAPSLQLRQPALPGGATLPLGPKSILLFLPSFIN